jgi:hypothetical protein
MANFNRADVKTNNALLIDDNTSENITPADVRDALDNNSDSNVNRLTDPYLKFLGTTAGTNTAYTLTNAEDYPGDAYNTNMYFILEFDQTNGANPTLNINALGAKDIYISLTSQVTDASTLQTNSRYLAVYNSSIDGILLVLLLVASTTSSSDVTRTGAGSLTISSVGKYVATGSISTWTLPAGSSAIIGSEYVLINNGSGNVTVDGNGSDAISQSDPFIMYPGTRYTAIWDGVEWCMV